MKCPHVWVLNFPIQISGVRSFCLIFLFGRFKWINWVLRVVHKWFKIILTHSPIIRDYILVSQHKHTWPSSEAVTSFVILIPSKYKSNWLISFSFQIWLQEAQPEYFRKHRIIVSQNEWGKKKNLEKLWIFFEGKMLINKNWVQNDDFFQEYFFSSVI